MYDYLDSQPLSLPPQEAVYPHLADPTSALRQISHQHRGLLGNQNPMVGAVMPSGRRGLLPLLFCVHQENLRRSEILCKVALRRLCSLGMTWNSILLNMKDRPALGLKRARDSRWQLSGPST